jgi:hypothetical protein
MAILFSEWREESCHIRICPIQELNIFYIFFGISMVTQGIGALTTATPHLIYSPPVLVYQPGVEAIPDLFDGKYGIGGCSD